MQVAVFTGNRKMELQSLEVPQPGENEVLLRVESCGVCGTDHHIYTGEFSESVQPPIVLGHEIAGRVDAIGPGVTHLRKNDFCAVDPVIGCGRCAHCRRNEPNLCADPAVIGYKRHGGFAQYCLVPADKVVPMDAAIGPEGGVLCETLACVLRGYDRLGFRAGANAMILGAGTVGLLWAQLLRNSLCSLLIQTEISPFRREKAAGLGADVVLDPQNDHFDLHVHSETSSGVDFIIDATGDPAAIEQAFGLLAKGGTLMPFGCCPLGSTLRIDPSQIFSKELRIIGSKMPPGRLDRAARVIESGHIACEDIVTDVRGLEATEGSVADFTSARNSQVKVAIDPWT
jgi:2-desacetyl-2-hydroxyethyl bacteriochlorophyllide A dehydrogenase